MAHSSLARCTPDSFYGQTSAALKNDQYFTGALLEQSLHSSSCRFRCLSRRW
jgi:hypothetical protein